MSHETLTHLNASTLIGFTEERGTAWHYPAEEQGDQSNHYPGPIPIEDVQRRLFNWRAESRPVAVEKPATVETMSHLSEAGAPVRWEQIKDRQAICRSDNHHVMGVFKDGYTRHQHHGWLLTTVVNFLDDDLAISSAGLLRGGAIAWTEVSIPETITTPEGVDFRPNLLATTSFDGSIATTYKRTITLTVCDNTRSMALAENGAQIKVRHSRYSQARIAQARDALGIVHRLADGFAAEVAQLCSTTVADYQWDRFLEHHVPRRDKEGHGLSGRALTIADNKRDSLNRLYRRDERVAPWHGTAYGVVQAINTYEHHEGVVRGATRAERNMLRTISGDFADLDRTTISLLNEIMA